MCRDCEVGLWEEEQICPGCGRNSRYGLGHKYCRGDLEGLTCLWAYEGVAQKIIRLAKYKHYFDFLSELTVDSYQLTVRDELFQFRKFLETGPVVVPVPLHAKRERERGFNQAKIIGHLASNIWHLNLENLLIRIRDTGQQVGRTREERLKNMANAFALSPKSQLPKNVLLVDDVWTTGATMRECARILKKAGAKYVWGLVLAR